MGHHAPEGHTRRHLGRPNLLGILFFPRNLQGYQVETWDIQPDQREHLPRREVLNK
jgi:hypothetical protein